MARQPLTPKRRKIQLEYMEPDFSSLDTAIDGISSSGSQEEAVAALAKATVGINSYFGQPRPMLDPHLTMALLAHPSASTFGYDPALFQSLHADMSNLLEARLKKYFAAVKVFVDKYGPQEYHISAGFPAGVSIAFTWKVGNSAAA